MSFNGRTSASQAENAGSIPVIRSKRRPRIPGRARQQARYMCRRLVSQKFGGLRTARPVVAKPRASSATEEVAGDSSS